MPTTQGVMHYNRGTKCIVRLIICIQSIRKYYSGNITLVQDGKHDPNLIKDLQKTFDLNVIYDENPQTCTMVRRIEICYKTPYDKTILIDTDTLTVGKIDEIFNYIDGYDFSVCHFAGWSSNGHTIAKRVLRYKNDYPQYIDAALAYGPAINCGVVAFPKGTVFLDEWLSVSKTGERLKMFIPDEVACQLLLPRYRIKIMPMKFNVSVNYDPGTEDKRIIHYHGRKHVINRPLCKLWIDAFYQACVDNICNIKKFVSREYGDRRLMKFLKGEFGWDKEIQEIKKVLNFNT